MTSEEDGVRRWQPGAVTTYRLDFRTLTEADAARAATWFVGDEEGQKEFGGFFGVHPKWWNLVKADTNRHGWTVWESDQPIGFAGAEVGADGVAAVAVYVRKPVRGRGLGTAIMRALGPVVREAGAVQIRGGVRPDNTPSLRAALASGGEVVGEDKDGYIEVLGPLL